MLLRFLIRAKKTMFFRSDIDHTYGWLGMNEEICQTFSRCHPKCFLVEQYSKQLDSVKMFYNHPTYKDYPFCLLRNKIFPGQCVEMRFLDRIVRQPNLNWYQQRKKDRTLLTYYTLRNEMANLEKFLRSFWDHDFFLNW